MERNRIKRAPDKKDLFLLVLYVMILGLVIRGASFLYGVVKEQRETSDEGDVSQQAENVEDVEDVAEKEPYLYWADGVSFYVDGDWMPYEGYEGAFILPDKKSFYQLQGISQLDAYEPEAFYNELLKFYGRSYEIERADEILAEKSTVDGDRYKVGRIEMTDQTTRYMIDVVICQEKDIVVTLCGQCAKESNFSGDIGSVTETIRFQANANQ
ncbi:MAG: hypothetical protein IJ833_02635 [Lachnospiraceae bacterium]|nr:hypothetical protein [Lachnospiraceae bacterium]